MIGKRLWVKLVLSWVVRSNFAGKCFGNPWMSKQLPLEDGSREVPGPPGADHAAEFLPTGPLQQGHGKHG